MRTRLLSVPIVARETIGLLQSYMSQNNTGTFADLGIATNLLEVLTKKGFQTPTPIQQQVIPGALDGSDVIGIAQTGTGKTLAFAIPMLQRVARSKGQGLIIVPTRELAEQVNSELKNIGSSLGLRTAILIGGTNEDRQITALKKNPHVVVATPGRLMDFVERKIYKLKFVRVVTLDEADRMLDMGFLPSIKKVMAKVPDSRQTMLFSATMPSGIGKLANDFMHTPLRVEIAPQGTSAKNVAQELYIVPQKQKMALLKQVLKQYSDDTTIIFSRTKHGAKRIKQKLEKMGHTAAEIHGNRSQNQRKKALEGFTKKKFRVLVATDVAARGIDVDHLSLVINYDIPDNSLEDYVHRIGRTGRAGRSGRAITFATPSQKRDVRSIEKIINKSLDLLDLPELPKEEQRPVHQPRVKVSRGKSSGGYKRKQPPGYENFEPEEEKPRSYSKRGTHKRRRNSASNSRPNNRGNYKRRSRRRTA